MISDKLSKLEILSDSPPPPPIRYADLEGVSGVPQQDDIKPNGPMR